MQPCALIIIRANLWNSGAKTNAVFEHTLVAAGALASLTVVLTQTSVVTPVTMSSLTPPVSQHRVEVRRVESALVGLVDDGLARRRIEVRDDVVFRLAADQNPPHGSGIADANLRAAENVLGVRQIEQIPPAPLAGVRH
jgi:hypothetical protein